MPDDDLDEIDFGDDSAEAEDLDSSPIHVTFADDSFDADSIYTAAEESVAETPCEFLTGSAGTGKTFEILRRCQEDPSYAVLTSSTGISAVNLNATTINSLLGFFDLDSLRDAFVHGSAARKLREVIDEGYRNVVLDEISMVSHQMLDILIHIFDGVNQNLKNTQHPIGLILVGDFAQLPPIPEGRGKNRGATPWAFEAASWERFDKNTTQLTIPRRQADPTFLAALAAARKGSGEEAVSYLKAGGIQFESANDLDFDGTTILAENKHVDLFNMEAMKKVRGRDMFLPTRRWGKERAEWKNIPHPQVHVRENAYVMILSNQKSGDGGTRNRFEFVNGDCGHIRGITARLNAWPLINVELVRTGEIVKVGPVIRNISYKDKPDGWVGDEKIGDLGRGRDPIYFPKPHFNRSDQRYVSGQIQYYPIRLAYATTAHKSQGLSLDKCQIDMRTWQFKNPGMGYISLSRCRTLEGLRIVGQAERVAAACVADPKVTRWL